MKESSTYQAILEEGREAGRAEGRTEGAVTEARKLLRKFGERAFGPPDSQAAAILDHLEDLERLEEMIDQVSSAASWQELLAPAAGGRRDRRRSGPRS